MSNAQSQYIIERVLFYTDRFPEFSQNNNPNSKPIDIRGSVAELNIYESLERPYLTASMTFVDDTKLKSKFGIKGSEKIQIGLQAKESSKLFLKNFMITGLASNKSVNDKTEVHTVTLLEEHAYLSNIQKISKSYKGHPELIISNILKSELNKEIFFFSRNSSQQSPMRVNIPYWKPLEAADWLRDRMAYSNGSPYFLYSTLRNDNLIMNDLDTLMREDAWNKEDAYTFSQAAAITDPGSSNSPDRLRKELFHIKSFTATSVESTLRLAEGGAIGSHFNVHDLTSGTTSAESFHSANETLNKFVQSIDTGADIESSLGYDNTLMMGPTEKREINISSFPSKIFSSIVTSRQHYEEDGKTPLAGYHDEPKQSALYKLKIKSASLRAILMNNVYQINVTGIPYLASDGIGVGTNIQVHYPESTMVSKGSNQLDKDKSGKFLIYRTRHKFTEGIHDTIMDIVKLTDKTK